MLAAQHRGTPYSGLRLWAASKEDALWQVAAKAEADGWQLAQERTTWYLEQLRARGMALITPAPELMAGLNKIGVVMLNDWLKDTLQNPSRRVPLRTRAVLAALQILGNRFGYSCGLRTAIPS